MWYTPIAVDNTTQGYIVPRPQKPNRHIATIASYQPSLTPTEWAYVAGIIDGEGSISIVRAMKKVTRPNGEVYDYIILTPSVQINNTNQPLLTWLGQKLDMRVNSRQKSRLSGATLLKREPSVCYVMTVAGFRCYNLLAGILPYMIVKKAQAETLMRFISRRSVGKSNQPYSLDDVADWQQIRSLNRNGSAPYSELVDLTRLSMTSQRLLQISSQVAS